MPVTTISMIMVICAIERCERSRGVRSATTARELKKVIAAPQEATIRPASNWLSVPANAASAVPAMNKARPHNKAGLRP